jgi:transposase-like protein
MNPLTSRSQRRRRSTAQERTDWVLRYEESGLTQKDFCRRYHLRLSTLQRWMARRRVDGTAAPAQTSGQWQELKLSSSPGTPRWAVELVRSDGLTVRLTTEAPPALVVKLLRVRGC